jgi:hypothetical protein
LLERDEEGVFRELEADSVTFGERGIVEISDWEGLVCGQSLRVIKSGNVSGNVSGWKARRSDGVIKAYFSSESDGVYLNFVSGGTRIIIR